MASLASFSTPSPVASISHPQVPDAPRKSRKRKHVESDDETDEEHSVINVRRDLLPALEGLAIEQALEPVYPDEDATSVDGASDSE